MNLNHKIIELMPSIIEIKDMDLCNIKSYKNYISFFTDANLADNEILNKIAEINACNELFVFDKRMLLDSKIEEYKSYKIQQIELINFVLDNFTSDYITLNGFDSIIASDLSWCLLKQFGYMLLIGDDLLIEKMISYLKTIDNKIILWDYNKDIRDSLDLDGPMSNLKHINWNARYKSKLIISNNIKNNLKTVKNKNIISLMNKIAEINDWELYNIKQKKNYVSIWIESEFIDEDIYNKIIELNNCEKILLFNCYTLFHPYQANDNLNSYEISEISYNEYLYCSESTYKVNSLVADDASWSMVDLGGIIFYFADNSFLDEMISFLKSIDYKYIKWKYNDDVRK